MLVRQLGDQLYTFDVVKDPKALPADSAIICLAGGKHRIESALKLFAEGVGSHLLIVGAGRRATPATVIRSHGAELSFSPERFARIQVETESRNTIENAFAVREFLHAHPEIRNVVLVTSGYHMRRARFMITHQVQPRVTILPLAATSAAADVIDRGNWWHSWLGINLTMREYAKFLLAAFVLPKVGDAPEGEASPAP